MIYTNWQGLPLLFITLIINIIILIVLLSLSFEPRISVEELEKELGEEPFIEITYIEDECDDDIV